MEIKDYLIKMIADKRAKIADLQKRGQESEDVNEVKAIINEVEEIKTEISEAEAQLAALDEKEVVESIPETPAEEETEEVETEEEKEEAAEETEEVEAEEHKEEETAEEVKEEEKNEEPTSEEVRSSDEWTKVDASNLTSLATYEQRGGNKMENLELRTAFMNAIQSGDLSKLEKRDGYTTTGNVEYVIPENLINDIITEINDRGYILNLCNKTNYAVGQTIPVGLISISASWVGTTNGDNNSGEGLGSSVQAGGVESTITFLNYKLRCVVGLTHEAGIQSLPIFEKKFVQQVSDAMIEALETAVVSGTGVNQPKGILLETPKSGKALDAAELTYADALKFVGAVPKKYRNGAVAFMSQNTFYDFMAIVDKNGQPVARVNAGVDGDMKQYLFGMPVIFADEYLADFATAETGATFAFIYNFKEYTLNTNYNLGISQRDVWENENREIKAVLACDGKAVTINSLVTLKKGISA